MYLAILPLYQPIKLIWRAMAYYNDCIHKGTWILHANLQHELVGFAELVNAVK
jgi:hypothetical protein